MALRELEDAVRQLQLRHADQAGRIKELQQQLDDAEQQITANLQAGPRRGTAAQRAATTSLYFQLWQDTDGAQHQWIGNRSGGWRRYSGNATAAATEWTTLGSVTGALMAARTVTFTVPTVLESDEWLSVASVAVGTGFAFIGGVAVTRGATTTDVTVRFMQLLSHVTQPLTVAWAVHRA